jgi:acyl carrier protein
MLRDDCRMTRQIKTQSASAPLPQVSRYQLGPLGKALAWFKQDSDILEILKGHSMLMERQTSEIHFARRDPVVDRVLALIADYAEHEPCNVNLETKLNDLRHYGLDSLVMMGVILEFGECFGIRVDELIGDEVTTVGDLVSVVKRRRRDIRSREPLTPARASRSVLYSKQSGGGDETEPELEVRREDIVFSNVDRRRVQIEVTVTNPSANRSPRQQLRLQAAPLGAFLPWRDLTTMWVPPLEPGASVTVSTEVDSPRPRALGRIDRIPPQRLITALGMSDDGSRDRRLTGESEPPASGPLGPWLSPWLSRRRRTPTTSPSTALPPDPADLWGRPNPHWAGNINVLIGRTAVERHRAEALRIYPGRRNVAALFVGDGQPDEYSFELHGEGATWNACLSQFGQSAMSGKREFDQEIELATWHKVSQLFVVCVVIQPPESCDSGELEVHVTRKSTGKTAIVEFSLDPSARGPGCYTL